MNKEDCLICGAPLEYLNQDQLLFVPSATNRSSARPAA